MTNPDRIEAAARAICEADPLSPAPDAPIIWGGKPAKAWELRASILRQAIDAGLFCHPAKAWLAPRDATEGMVIHAEGYTDFYLDKAIADTRERRIQQWQLAFRLMREAYIKDHPAPPQCE